MTIQRKAIDKSPVGLASLASLIGLGMLYLAWRIGRDSGLGWFGSLIAIFSLGLQVFTSKVVWDLRRRYVRQAVLSDGIRRLQGLIGRLKTANADKDWAESRSCIGKLLGILESIRVHVDWDMDVQIELVELNLELEKDNRSFPPRIPWMISQVERLAEIAAASLKEIEWGGSDD